MAQWLDKIIVVDVEATCWAGELPPGQESEIIEIGLCLLDVRTGQRAGKRSILVRPVRSTVSEFCTRLTTLTPEAVAAGLPFPEACALLRREYDTAKRAWASYGDYDRQQFWRQCRQSGTTYPFGATHLNVKNFFALAMNLTNEVSLAEAFASVEFEVEGTYHRGDDDAWNIARLLAWILNRLRVK